ncbi:PQQ-dependent dehydrogenase, methanol/ethanol family [Acidocella sp.]|uniref:PQQ-dependent dehydrogenase, methanol/ethanol family n=1 Tax=Acidocella sp. TaxID=50710 RepID=UPI0026180357|nr:PQQ-dependent dehydrogenase, methanol/ethanol family [Acidocella sp.]
MKFGTQTTACGLLLLAMACAAAPAHASSPGIGAGDNWTNHNGDSNETAFSQLNQITKANIGKLGLAWSLQLPGEASLEGTPVAVNGVLYFTGSEGKVYAVNGSDGKVLWTYDPQIWKVHPASMAFNFGANRGVAYDNGKIFSAALDGRLFALDAKTGALLWSVQTVSLQGAQTITGAPRVFAGKVIIGQGGADFGARGYVTAYDQATGKQLWRFYTVPASPAQNAGDPAMEMAAKTWSPDFWQHTGGGGGPWDGITFDAELNRIYIGTANAGPYDPAVRSPGTGDNLFTASIVALDADTGKYIWHYQVVPRDEWDYDCTQQMTLADLTIDGKPRKVLMQAPKDGFFYVLDRETGKLISADKIGKVTWAERIDMKTGRPVEAPHDRYDISGRILIWPAPAGEHSWQAMSYDPQTGLVYIPTMQLAVSMVKDGSQPGGFQVGPVNVLTEKHAPGDGTGSLLAWNPVTQKAAWRVPHEYIWNGGVLSTAGGLVFQGTADGYFSGYDAQTGADLWHQPAGGGVIAAPMSYMAGGQQHVAVLVGYGGTAAAMSGTMNVGWKWGEPRYLLSYALGGTAAPPPMPVRTTAIHAVDNPKLKLDPAQVSAGAGLYLYCAACHGVNLVSTGSPAPDLRESRIALDLTSFNAVVHGGALIQAGMPRFNNLTPAQIDDLYAYIRAGARAALAAPATKPQ